MAISYGFFDSSNHDRIYNAEQVSKILEGIVSDGVVYGVYNSLFPYVRDNFFLMLSSGRAFLDNRWYEQDNAQTIYAAAGGTVKGTLCLQLNYDKREIKAVGIEGTVDSYPSIYDTDRIKYLKLCDFTTNETEIVIDTIYIGTNVTPFIRGLKYIERDLNEKTAPATDTTLGTIKVGTGLAIDADGTLSATGEEITIDTALSTTSGNPVANRVITLKINDIELRTAPASQSTLGVVKVGNNLNVTQDGTLSAMVACDTALDEMSAEPVANYVLAGRFNTLQSDINTKTAAATASTRGTVKVGNGLAVDADGTLSATGAEITIDTELSTTSGNPVANRVITGSINTLDAAVTYMQEHKANVTALNSLAADVRACATTEYVDENFLGKNEEAASAAVATKAENVDITTLSASSNYPLAILSSSSLTSQGICKAANNTLTYNPYSYTLTVNDGNGFINAKATSAGSADSASSADVATKAENVEITSLSASSNYVIPLLSSSSLTSQGICKPQDNKLTYNPSTHTLTIDSGNGTINAKVTGSEQADKVKQGYTGSNSDYPVMLANTTDTTSVSDFYEKPLRTNAVKINPYSGTVKASKFDGKATSAGSADYATSSGSASSASYASEAGTIADDVQGTIFSINLSSATNDYTIYVSGLYSYYKCAIFRFLPAGGAVHRTVLLPLEFINKNCSSTTPYRCYVNTVPFEFYKPSSNELRVKVNSSSAETFKLISLISLF